MGSVPVVNPLGLMMTGALSNFYTRLSGLRTLSG